MQKRAFSAFSDASAILKTSSPFGMKFGPGGRSSNAGITATVFGGTGFVGRYVLSELGAIGTRAYVPYRGCELEPRHIKPMFDVGQLGLVQFSGRDEESIANALKYSDVVINLIGKHYETKHFVPTRRADGNLSRVNFDFEEVHVKIPQTIARLAKENGVKCLIHMSALSADVNSASQWSQSKARGELAVRKEFPDAIIVKPSTIFGAEDRVLNWIAETMKRSPLGFPLLNGGQNVVQPVYVGDLGKAVKEIVFGHERFKGRDFQLVGPHEYTYKELAEYVADVTYQPTELVDIHPTLARLAGSVLEQTINPFLTKDMVEQMLVDNVAKKDDSLLSFKDLEIEPRAVDRMAFDYMHRFRAGGHFMSVQGYH